MATYFVTRGDGVVELRQDSADTVPDGAIELTDSEYYALSRGAAKIVNGQVVPNV